MQRGIVHVQVSGFPLHLLFYREIWIAFLTGDNIDRENMAQKGENMAQKGENMAQKGENRAGTVIKNDM